MVKYTIDDILKYVEENNIKYTRDLPSNYLNYIYRYKLSHLLPFLQEKKKRAKQRKLQKPPAKEAGGKEGPVEQAP